MSTLTQDQHKNYTYNEWGNLEYFDAVIEYLKEQKIKSFIDLGGCTGEVSNILLERIPTIEYGLVFEPYKENYDFIKKNVKDERVIVENKAIYYGKDKIALSIKSEWKNIGSWSIYFSNDYPDNSITCDCTTLEKYFEDKKYDFIKIDIEGSEFNILENAEVLNEVQFIELEIHYHHYSVEHDGGILGYLKKYLPNHEIEYYLGNENSPGNLFLIKK